MLPTVAQRTRPARKIAEATLETTAPNHLPNILLIKPSLTVSSTFAQPSVRVEGQDRQVRVVESGEELSLPVAYLPVMRNTGFCGVGGVVPIGNGGCPGEGNIRTPLSSDVRKM